MPIVPERLRQFFAKGRTGHHVLTLASGTLIAQALNVLAAPILTRLYVPADFGRNELFISFLSVASVAVSLRYDAAIVTARTRRTAAYVVLLSTVLIVPVTVAAVATMHVMICQSWFGFGNLPSYSPLLLALALPAAGLFVVFRSSLIREHSFGPISRVTVIQQGGRVLSQVALGALGVGWIGLLTGEIVGRVAGVGTLFRATRPMLSKLLVPYNPRRMRTLARAFWKFPVLTLPSSLTDILGLTIALPAITRFYGPQAAGYYALVQRVLSVPSALVAASVADVFHARLAQYVRTQPLAAKAFVLRTAGVIFVAGLVPCALLMLAGPPLIPLVFGAQWAPAGQLLAALVPTALALVIVSTLSRIVLVYQAQELKVLADVVNLTLPVTVLWLAYRRGWRLAPAVGALSAGTVAAYSIYFMLLLFVVFRAHRRAATVARRAAERGDRAV